MSRRSLKFACFGLLLVVVSIGSLNQGLEAATPTSSVFATQLLVNPSFENGPSPAPWTRFGPCDYRVYTNSAVAFSGVNYLAVNRNNDANCISVSQDVSRTLVPGEMYRFATWVKSSTGVVRNGAVAIWALGGQNISRATGFAISSQEWQCIETSIQILRNDHTVLRAEVYVDSVDRVDYHLDNATLVLGGEPLCPPAPTLTPTKTPTSTLTQTPTPTSTLTATPTHTATPTPTPTNTPTHVPTHTPTTLPINKQWFYIPIASS